MPCRGCRDKLSGPEGQFKMMFIGKPDGKLMKGAPAGYKQGEVRLMPYRHSKFPFWKIIEEVPKLVIPEAGRGESVYSEPIYVPDEEDGPAPDAPIEEFQHSDEFLRRRAEKIKSDYAKQGLYLLDEDDIFVSDDVDYDAPPKATPTPVEEEEPAEEEATRDNLKRILTERGVEFNPRTRTETLRKMVEELEPAPQE